MRFYGKYLIQIVAYSPGSSPRSGVTKLARKATVLLAVWCMQLIKYDKEDLPYLTKPGARTVQPGCYEYLQEYLRSCKEV